MKDKNNNAINTRSQEELLKERMQGKLPVIDIVGHPFYVDLRMNMLRAKDDFLNLGISFNDLENWYNEKGDKVWICYNPKKHSHEEPDFTTITEIPKGLYILEIPAPQQLDPVGYAWLHGWNLDKILKETPIQDNMEAKLIPWEKTYFFKMVKENRAKQQPERKQPQQKRVVKNDYPAQRGKGRKR